MNRRFTIYAFALSAALFVPQFGGRAARAEFLFDCSLDQVHTPAFGPLGTHRRKGIDDSFDEHAFDGRFFGDVGQSGSIGRSSYGSGHRVRYGAGVLRPHKFTSESRRSGGNDPWGNGTRGNPFGSRNGGYRGDDHWRPDLQPTWGHSEWEQFDAHREGNRGRESLWSGRPTQRLDFCFGNHSTHDHSNRHQGVSSVQGHGSFVWIRHFPHDGCLPSAYSELCGDHSATWDHSTTIGQHDGGNRSGGCDHLVWCHTPRHHDDPHCGSPGRGWGGTGGHGGSNGNPNNGTGNSGGGGGWTDPPGGGSGNPDPGDPTGTTGDPDPVSITHAPVPSTLVLSLSSLGFAGLFRTVRQRFNH